MLCQNQVKQSRMRKTSERNYDPNQKLPPSEKPTLETDQQATLWMECVDQTSCEN